MRGSPSAPSVTHTIALPASTLAEIRKTLVGESGATVASRALRGAGAASGDAILRGLAGKLDTDPAFLDEPGFWRELTDYLTTAGWGGVSHQRVHPGLGVLRSPNWSECDPSGHEDRPTCWFGSGVLSRIFTKIAGAPIDVIEASCRSRGDDVCTFLFGSAEAIDHIRPLLGEAGSLDDALLRL